MKIKFSEILTDEVKKEEALEILRIRNLYSKTRKKESPYYDNEYALLDKMIKTWKIENELKDSFSFLSWCGDDHDYIYSYGENNFEKYPDFFFNDTKETLDLKVSYKSIGWFLEHTKFSHYHGADFILVFSVADYLEYKASGFNGWYILYKNNDYKLDSNTWNHQEFVRNKKFDKLAEKYMKMEFQK